MGLKQTLLLSSRLFARDLPAYRGLNSLLRFRQKTRIHFKVKHFTVKTVENRRELLQSYRLRYDVFHKEYMGKTFPVGFDTDIFDRWADHLVVIDERISRVVASYRLISSEFSHHFYSATEFDISNFLARPGIKLELSRTCIHKDFRKGSVIVLLWRGLGEYIKASRANYLFGCSSIKTMDLDELCGVFKELDSEGYVDSSLSLPVLPEFRMDGFSKAIKARAGSQEQSKIQIPTLLKGYLRTGATVAPDPALDRKFRCVDFFTVLDVSKMNELSAKKYLKN